MKFRRLLTQKVFDCFNSYLTKSYMTPRINGNRNYIRTIIEHRPATAYSMVEYILTLTFNFDSLITKYRS